MDGGRAGEGGAGTGPWGWSAPPPNPLPIALRLIGTACSRAPGMERGDRKGSGEGGRVLRQAQDERISKLRMEGEEGWSPVRSNG